ncbi:DUF411 domain-containing protein [Acidovorax sp. NCPPB 4044]|uniref:DUF411 domain-containing protein n=1 Tax=Acidovorax sp. NCPPB 4044 TaxID=2940490 RepID=UPI002302F25C|nr:DUF411 domain-containing protein [Acidovorax sp. NCPPB 4044]MDA8520260.1 DUF411 domain-containing protein [Acidovorax sp. NCPPB 4044]
MKHRTHLTASIDTAAPARTLPRRALLAAALSAATAGALATLPRRASAQAAPAAAGTPLEVWKDPNCGCCQDWIDHLRAHGFAPTVHETGNTAVRKRLGLPDRLGSCHTALVGGYLLEGHVPAADVQRLLREKPQALGLAVPGMPIGSPGMDGAIYRGRRDAYDVLLVARDGSTRVFKHYAAQAGKEAA